MVGFIGLVSAILLVFMLFIYLGVLVNKYLFKGKNELIKTITNFSRKNHPIIGGILLVTGGLHGYLALGGAIMFHTGYLLYGFFVIAILGGVTISLTKKYSLVKFHRVLGISLLVFLLLHILF